MKYQISYLSPSGHCKKIAEAFEDILEDAYVTDLKYDNDVQGEIHLVGFEINESGFKAIPYEVMELLDQLEEKTVLIFATCPFQADQNAKDQMERSLQPFLPDSCDYRGLFLCSGEASQQLLNNLGSICQQHPEDQRASALLENCKASVGHPDEEDIMKACLYVTKELELD